MNEIENAIELCKLDYELFPDDNKHLLIAIGALENKLPFMGDVQHDIFKSVLYERYRQDNKWGEQNHVLERWTGILGEEYGELCEAINETIFVDGTNGGYETMKKEAVHVAAVSIAFIEYLEKNKNQYDAGR